jgi:hypothetical protein
MENTMARELSRMVRGLEAEATLPAGIEERFAGTGATGLPFASEHVLALRRFPASSIDRATRRCSIAIPRATGSSTPT